MGDAVAETESHGLGDSGADFWTVHQGDARDLGEFLRRAALVAGKGEEPFLQTTITSPPYATLVDYGSENQIGFGQSYEDYLDSCRAIFETIFRATLNTGSMWLVADSLLRKRQGRGSASRLVPLPFELAAVAESVGWTLREVVVWRKDRTRPWSHRGKLRNGFEYVLLFVKSNAFVFNVDQLRDTRKLQSWWVKYPERHNPWGMTPDNVWEIPIPVQGSWNDSAFRHACPFPPELVRRMVILSSNKGDIVLDPFAGTGSVVAGAQREGRRGLGIELNPKYVSAFRQQQPAKTIDMPQKSSIGGMTQRLLELRMLKYPKELAKQVLRAGFTTAQIRAVLLEIESVNFEPARTGYGEVSCSVVISSDLSELEGARLSRVLTEATGKAPLSKYGLAVSVHLRTAREACDRVTGREVSVYLRGRTWYADSTLPGAELEEWLNSGGDPLVVPVISPLNVRQSLEESL